MFSVGWPEFTIVLIVALIVIGPRDLPATLHKIGKWVGAARRMSREFQRHVDDMVRDSELGELKDGVNSLKRTTNVRSAIENTIDPDGSLRKTVSGKLDDDTPKPTQALGAPSAPAATNGAASPNPASDTSSATPTKPAAAAAKSAASKSAVKGKSAAKSAKSKPATKSTAAKPASAKPATAKSPASKSASTKKPAAAKSASKPAASRKRTAAPRKPKSQSTGADASTDA